MNNTTDERNENSEPEFQAIEGFAVLIFSGGDNAVKEALRHIQAIDRLILEGKIDTAREYIDRLVEECFRQSDTYYQALALFRNWDNLKGGVWPEDALKEVIDRLVDKPDDETPTAPAEDELLEPLIDAQDWLTVHGRTRAGRERVAPYVRRIREIQREADAERK